MPIFPLKKRERGRTNSAMSLESDNWGSGNCNSYFLRNFPRYAPRTFARSADSSATSGVLITFIYFPLLRECAHISSRPSTLCATTFTRTCVLTFGHHHRHWSAICFSLSLFLFSVPYDDGLRPCQLFKTLHILRVYTTMRWGQFYVCVFFLFFLVPQKFRCHRRHPSRSLMCSPTRKKVSIHLHIYTHLHTYVSEYIHRCIHIYTSHLVIYLLCMVRNA